ncbi:MAG: VOC family protein [Candidatus Binatia bacterium]|nr:VOC family protein [Candidatus Binatia bacterium]
MTPCAKSTVATVIPCLRYRDVAAAISWLCAAFGFERHLVAEDEEGKIVHAQLRFGNGMVMLGPASDAHSDFNRFMKQPDQVGGETQAPYVVVNDADSLYARAQAAGAEIVIPLHDEAYGGRGFSCRDPEGHLWYFGTYDPWGEAHSR